MPDTFKSFQELTDTRVDRTKGVMRRVCMLEVGEAKGHDVWIDKRTLETALECAKKFTEGLKVKFRHGKTGEYQNVLEETFGLLKDYAIEGSKVVADLWLLESLDDKIKAKAFEMAEKMANQFGLSIVFKGTNEKIGGKNFLRCTALESTDLTDKPAATSGLFSMSKPIKYEAGESGKHSKDCLCGECESAAHGKKMESLETGLKALTDLVTGLAAKISAAPAASTAATGALEYTDKDGKTIKLSGQDIATRLEAADKMVSDAKASVEKAERAALVAGIVREGRIVTNPETNVAYKMEELAKLDVSFLKFAAKNAPILLTQARATYTQTGGGPASNPQAFTKKVRNEKGELVDVALSGTELTEAAWESKYGDIDAMIAKANNPNLS
jgi:hypothetical protein